MPPGLGKEPRFLVIRLSSFGDVVLAEPVTRSLKEAYPDCHVSMATCDQYRGIVSLFPYVDSIVAYSRGRGLIAAAMGPPDLEFEVVIDLQNSLKSRSISRNLRAGRILRYRRQLLRRLLAVYLPWVWKGQLRHTLDLYFDAIRPLCPDVRVVPPALTVPHAVRAELARRLGGGPFIGVCPGGSSPYKRWPAAYFRELIRLLLQSGHRVVVIGSGRDAAAVDAAVCGLSDCGVVPSVTDDISELASLLSLCRVTVSNDSGLMHLAAGVGSRVVAIFGPTSPILGFAPPAPGSTVVTRALPCSPCSYHGNRPCRYERMACMEEIKPSEVNLLVEDLVSRDAER